MTFSFQFILFMIIYGVQTHKGREHFVHPIINFLIFVTSHFCGCKQSTPFCSAVCTENQMTQVCSDRRPTHAPCSELRAYARPVQTLYPNFIHYSWLSFRVQVGICYRTPFNQICIIDRLYIYFASPLWWPFFIVTTSSNGNDFRVNGFFWGNPPVTVGFLPQRASSTELWCFFLCVPAQTVDTLQLPVIWYTMTVM